MKKTYIVSLLNQKFTLKSEADERHVQRVTDHVNRTLFDIREKSHSVSSLRVALLACLNMADELFKLKAQSQEKNSTAQRKVEELIAQVEAMLQ